jgi:hypothetical protein
LKHIYKNFPGVELNDQLVILVPSAEFRAKLLNILCDEAAAAIPHTQLTFVSACAGAAQNMGTNAGVAAKAPGSGSSSRVICDTLDSFDGMERLFVLAVGLDTVAVGNSDVQSDMASGCSGIYRAITRSHMFVGVVQEHLKGGWLEYITTVTMDETSQFDETKESARVHRENIKIISNEAERVPQLVQSPKLNESTGNLHGTRGDGDRKGVSTTPTIATGASVPPVLIAPSEAATVSLLMKQSVWHSNQATLTDKMHPNMFTPLVEAVESVLLKIVVIGSSRVGKSSLVSRCVQSLNLLLGTVFKITLLCFASPD